MSPFHTLAEVLPQQYLEMRQDRPLFKRFSIRHTKIQPEVYTDADAETVSGVEHTHARPFDIYAQEMAR